MSQMQKAVLVGVLVVTTLGCARRSGFVAKAGRAVAPPGGFRTYLMQTSLLPGATNAGQLPSLELKASAMSIDRATLVANALQANVVFSRVGANERLRAIVTVHPDIVDSGSTGKKEDAPGRVKYNVYFSIVPATSLRDSDWYDVILTAPIDGLAIAADDVYNLGSGVVTRFHTTSAPQLRTIRMIRQPIDGRRVLLVTLSEPVKAQELVSGGFTVSYNGGAVEGCVAYAGKCLRETQENGTISAFEYQFQVDIPSQFLVNLAPLKREYAFDTSSWSKRAGGPDVLGWSNVE